MTTFLYSVHCCTIIYCSICQDVNTLTVHLCGVSYFWHITVAGVGGEGFLLYKALWWYNWLQRIRKEYTVWCRYNRITLGFIVRGGGVIYKGGYSVHTVHILLILPLNYFVEKEGGGGGEL